MCKEVGRMRRFSAALLAAVLLLTAAGCGRQTDTADDGRLQVVCTLFPYYDFGRQIGCDEVDAVLGGESSGGSDSGSDAPAFD